MEMVVSEGKILTLAPFCKSFAPVANNRREGRRGCSLSVCARLANICLCSGGGCCANVVQAFSHLSTWCSAALSTSVLWGESSPGETKAQAGTPQSFLSCRVCLVSSAAGGGTASTNPYGLGRVDFTTACSTFCKSAFWWQFPVSSCSQSIHTERTP